MAKEPWGGVITVDDTNGERIVTEEVTIESSPGDETADDAGSKGKVEQDRITRILVTDEYGRYDPTFRPEDGDPEQVEFWVSMGYPPRTDRYVISDDGIEYDETLHGAVGRLGHPSKSCSWDEEGNIV